MRVRVRGVCLSWCSSARNNYLKGKQGGGGKGRARVVLPVLPQGKGEEGRAARGRQAGAAPRTGNSLAFASSSRMMMMRKRLAIAQERDQQHPPGAAGVEGQEDQDNVVEIQSIRHLIDELERAEDKLVVVSFHATWCAACRKVQPLVQDEVKGREDVVLLKVRYDTNKQICKTLGVRKLPYFHFYRGSEGKLEDFSASAKTFHRIKEAIAQHGTPRCTLGENHIVPDELQELVGRPQDPK